MQKSQEGLLRTILFHILQHSPMLISSITSIRGKEDPSGLTPWSRWTTGELVEALGKIPSDPGNKICIFIDGLDEYKGDLKAEELLEPMMRLIESSSIKLCVSSRQTADYANLFQPFDNIQLQEHTNGDIARYIHQNLKIAQNIVRFPNTSDDSRVELVCMIQSKAQGVFFWVYLIVRSLQEGIKHGDSVSDHRHRVNTIPGTFEGYLHSLLEKIDPFYKTYTARALLWAADAPSSYYPLDLYFLEHEIHFPDYALVFDGTPLIPSIGALVQRTKQRLSLYCANLLEVRNRTIHSFIHSESVPKTVSSSESVIEEVVLSHDTVRSFIRTESVATLLRENAGTSFDSNISKCRSCLATMKLAASLDNLTLNSIFSNCGNFFLQLGVVERSRNGTEMELLENLIAFLDKPNLSRSNESNVSPGSRLGNFLYNLSLQAESLVFFEAVRHGLHLHVAEKLKTAKHLLTEMPAALFPQVVERLCHCPGARRTDSRMITILVTNGLNAHQNLGSGKYRDFTLWTLWLRESYSYYHVFRIHQRTLAALAYFEKVPAPPLEWYNLVETILAEPTAQHEKVPAYPWHRKQGQAIDF